MAAYDSDSSDGGDDIQTNVLLGYATHEATGDDFSQLGGRPIWLDGKSKPSGSYAKCQVCNEVMNLLLQLNGDLPDWFPGHERRLYVFGCRKKPCRRKKGSVRALRAVRASAITSLKSDSADETKTGEPAAKTSAANLGDTLFGVKSLSTSQANPFSTASSTGPATNPFASPHSKIDPSTTTRTTDSQSTTTLSETFAQKARISASPTPTAAIQHPPEPWPEDPSPYSSYHLDADKEYIEPEPTAVPGNARLDTEGEGSSAADEKAAFESSMDKTFQQFADRLSQNPEQVLRYEFGGQPLLYSKTDAVGKALSHTSEAKVHTSSAQNGSGVSKLPRCANCGAARVFELQLTPHAISELEADDMGVDGMDWGTIIVGVCSADCTDKAKALDEVAYFEEWVGVQWEQMVDKRA